MKLEKLEISSSFGSLQKGFQIVFREFDNDEPYKDWENQNFLPFCLAGLNGSGKSNVLEALSNIFYHLEGCVNVNQPENFRKAFLVNKSLLDAYSLQYFIVPKFGDEFISDEEYVVQKLYRVTITKSENQIPKLSATPYPFLDENLKDIRVLPTELERIERRSAPAKAFLPNLVIGYSSGENEILSIPYLKSRLLHFDEYSEDLKKNYKYKEPESNLLYVDYEMSQAVLLANLLFQPQDVTKVLADELGIVDIYRFRMNVHLHKLHGKKIIEQYISKIECFKRCATCFFESEDKILLDFWVNDQTKDAFQKNFQNIFELFRAFQILYTLNYRTVDEEIKSDVYQSKGFYTDGKVPIPKPEDNTFYFLDYFIKKRINEKGETAKLPLKNLSDGEQQFLHTLGICLMLKNRSVLLLLDEPETHFNPDWRSKFISTLKSTLTSIGSNNLVRDILITSHSPFIISDCYPDKVIVFEKEKNGIVRATNARELGINTYGTSVNILTYKIFKKKEGIGKNSMDKVAEYRRRFDSGQENVDDLKEQLNSELGDSIEKLILIKEMTDSKK